jgi:hypothetical protein
MVKHQIRTDAMKEKLKREVSPIGQLNGKKSLLPQMPEAQQGEIAASQRQKAI